MPTNEKWSLCFWMDERAVEQKEHPRLWNRVMCWHLRTSTLEGFERELVSRSCHQKWSIPLCRKRYMGLCALIGTCELRDESARIGIFYFWAVFFTSSSTRKSTFEIKEGTPSTTDHHWRCAMHCYQERWRITYSICNQRNRRWCFADILSAYKRKA